jgi:Tfp pilus assembly protein PilZ
MPVDTRNHTRLNITDGVTSTALKPIEGRNVSLGGICIQVEKKMKINDVIDMEFHLPGSSNKFTVHAKVKWQEKSDGEYLTGLEFVNISVVSENHG